jgi:succinyl-diaminopimelate desuccinylase
VVNNHTPVIELAKALIHCPSVTPTTAGVYDIIEAYLVPLGFNARRVTFGEGADAVENLYLRHGTAQPNFCFAGHTDVVPPGDAAAWTVSPFTPQVIGGELYGRGAEDMKGAIAAFMVAVKQLLAANTPNGSISFLITQDEEGNAVHGTKPMLGWLKEQGEQLTHCLVGEPTNPDALGEMIKIGRRGSISFQLTVRGKQGHAAYPERADNPVTRILNMLHALKHTMLDEGNEHFPPSNLEITTIDVGNPTSNIIPATASARFNVRFNNLHTSHSIAAWVAKTCAHHGEAELSHHVTGEAFLNEDKKLTAMLVAAVTSVTGKTPVLSTTGGTSDARYIKDVCPVIEFGTTGRTAHMVDERVEVKTLEGLVEVYQTLLRTYFA